MPRLDALFRFSLYLCLFISTASLAFTAWGQLADTLVFYIPMLVLVAFSWRLNDRWTLSVRGSNFVAVGIMVAWPVWLFVTLRGNRVRSDELDVELVRLALPFFAPLLSTLLLAKLYRPKAVRDWWTIHLMGLVQMVLACVLAMTNKLDRDAPLFPLAVLAYLLSLVWTLRNFNLYSLHMAPAGGLARVAGETEPRARLGLLFTLGWFVPATVVGLGLFFLVPRGTTALTSGAFGGMVRVAQTGFKPSMDLSNVGELTVSEELVFRASVRNRFGNPAQLPVSPRWRGVSCAEYEAGKWRPFRKDLLGYGRIGVAAAQQGQLLIAYELDIRKVRQGGAVSTDDVPNRVIGEIPLFTLDPFIMDSARMGVRPTGQVALDPGSSEQDRRMVSVHLSRQESCAAAMLQESRGVHNVFYQQLIAERDAGLQDWTQPVPGDLEHAMEEYVQVLHRLPQPLVKSGRLKRLAEKFLEAEKVPADASPRDKAKALERRLVSSGGYGYSLNRQRSDNSLDPNEDFLENVKEGTCERYASALALMLRAIGIPARVVIGFRGGDWNNVGQYYEVRELHSHAWVEAAVSASFSNTVPRTGGSIRWLSLDPTPQVEAQNRNQGLWAQNVSFARMLWEFFILDFSGDLQRQRFFNQLNQLGWDRLEAALRRYGTVGVVLWCVAFVLSLVLALVLLRIAKNSWKSWRAWRKEFAWLPTVPFWRQAIGFLMRRWRLKPVPTQTAAEFASAAASRLQASPGGAAVAEIPGELAASYYAVRFGGSSAEEAGAALQPKLDQLAQARP